MSKITTPLASYVASLVFARVWWHVVPLVLSMSLAAAAMKSAADRYSGGLRLDGPRFRSDTMNAMLHRRVILELLNRGAGP